MAEGNDPTRDALEAVPGLSAELEAKLEAMVARVVTDMQAQLEDIQARTKDMQAQLEDIQAQTKDMQAQTEDIQAQTKDMQAQTEDMRAQAKDLQAQVDILTMYRRRDSLREFLRMVIATLCVGAHLWQAEAQPHANPSTVPSLPAEPWTYIKGLCYNHEFTTHWVSRESLGEFLEILDGFDALDLAPPEDWKSFLAWLTFLSQRAEGTTLDSAIRELQQKQTVGSLVQPLVSQSASSSSAPQLSVSPAASSSSVPPTRSSDIMDLVFHINKQSSAGIYGPPRERITEQEFVRVLQVTMNGASLDGITGSVEATTSAILKLVRVTQRYIWGPMKVDPVWYWVSLVSDNRLVPY